MTGVGAISVREFHHRQRGSSSTRHAVPAWRLCIALATACPGACDEPVDADSPADDEAAILSVAGADRDDLEPILWSGCTAMVDHSQCELDSGPITVWIPGASAGWQWTIDGVQIQPSTVTPTATGTRIVLTDLADAERTRELELRDGDGDGDGEPVWHLEMRPYLLAASRFEYGKQRDRALASDDVDLRRAFARELLVDLDARPPIEQLARLGDARRLNFDQHDYQASALVIEPLLDRIVEVAGSLDRWGEQCEAASVGLYFGTFDLKIDRAEHWLQWEQPCRLRAPRWGLEVDTMAGTFSLRRGWYADAALRLTRAREVGEQLGSPLAAMASTRYAELLVRTGRWTEARRAITALEAGAPGPCARAAVDGTVGYFRLLARQRGDADLGDPRPVLLNALAKHEVGGPCHRVDLRNHDLIKLGLAAALRGDMAEVSDRLAAIDPATLTGKYPLQYDELRARGAIAAKNPRDAREALASMADKVRPDVQRDAGWRLHMLYAALAKQEGDVAAEIAAYRDAEAVIEDFRDGVESGAIRERWLASYHKSALRLVDRLVELGELDNAACAARTARTRALAINNNVAGRSWVSGPQTEPCSRTWARRPNELVLLLVPALDGTWRVFEIQDEVVQSVRTVQTLPGSATDDDGWWDQWTPALRRVDNVRILASEGAFSVPFHELEWEGVPLASRRAVVYGLDADPLPAPSLVEATAAVVFANVVPLRELDRYADDVAEVRTTLATAGWRVQLETGLDRDGLRATLPSVSLLHFYGHGARHRPGPGFASFPTDDVGTTSLLLGAQTHLNVEDIASLAAVPRWAVLLGCQLGFADRRGWSGGLNLAHAFLLAGSHQVIASTEPLDAAAAATLGPLLYPQQTPDDGVAPALDLSVLLQRAWADHLTTQTEPPRWRALRVWSR
ncbi:MAG: CHAT domain-containing protein [Nannocystaceae bacterium]|nr:CHAT domain-containing protein [Nannocystaceae bacterium]